MAERKAVYVDGSCTNNGRDGARGGYGINWGDNDPRNVSAPLPPGRQTNNRAEIYGAGKALEQARQSGEKSLEIRSDSHFMKDCVEKYIPDWRANSAGGDEWRTSKGVAPANEPELRYLDQEMTKFRQSGGDVTFTHVPGHKGDPGNEQADRFARQGASKRN